MNTKHLKAKILDLAIRGKLVSQDSSEGNATDLLKKVKKDKKSSFIIKGDDGRHYEQFADGTLKDIEADIPFEIPESWCWIKLDEISNSIIAGGDKPAICSSEKTETNCIPIYANAIAKNGLYGYTNNPQIIDKAITISARGTIGFTCIREEPFVPIVRLITLVPNLKLVNLKYLKSSFDVLLNMTEGSSIPQLTIPTIKTFKLPLPTLAEQERIVSAIEKAFEQIDIIEKNKLNLKNYIKQTKSKVLDLAIHGRLVEQNPQEGNAFELLEKIHNEKAQLVKQKKIKADKDSSFIIKADDGRHYEQFADGTLKDIEEEIPFEIPDSWCWCRLKELSNNYSVKDYKIQQKEIKPKGKYPVITQSSNFTEGYYDDENYLVNKNRRDVVIFGDHTRNVKFVNFPFVVGADGVKVLKIEKPFISKYIYYLIMYASKNIENRGYSRHFQFMETFIYPLPPLAEQQRIVAKIEQIFAQLDALEKALGNE